MKPNDPALYEYVIEPSRFTLTIGLRISIGNPRPGEHISILYVPETILDLDTQFADFATLWYKLMV